MRRSTTSEPARRWPVTAGASAYYRLAALAQQGIADLDRLPITVKILLENVLRRVDNYVVNRDHVLAVARWDPQNLGEFEIPF